MSASGQKRVLLLGASGMLGATLAQALPPHFTTYSPVPRNREQRTLSENIKWLSNPVDFLELNSLEKLLDECRPDVVINCIAVTPASIAAADPIGNIQINSLFPHILAKAARVASCKLIHISTDGVFSGARGYYNEEDLPDPPDIYGRSKLLGEVVDGDCLTLRTTFYGLSSGHKGLIDWLLTRKGQTVKGYKNYIFSGLSMNTLAATMITIIQRPLFLNGLYHMGGPAISKYDLLVAVSKRFGLDIMVEPVLNPVVNRSLDSSRFWEALGTTMPQSKAMIDEIWQEFMQSAL